MNFVKIQTDIIKAWEKSLSGKRSPYLYGETEDAIAIIDQQHAAYFIPKALWLLDINKVFEKINPFNISSLTKDCADFEPLKWTGNTRTLSDGRNVLVFADENGEGIVIDNDYIKRPGIKDLNSLTFRGNTKSPVFMFDGDRLVAFVMPILNWE